MQDIRFPARLTVALLFLLPWSVLSQTAATPADHTILYTGQMDGFLGSWSNCPAGSCSSAVTQQIEDLRSLKGKLPAAILIGMGDNLGPEISANQYQPNAISRARVGPDPLSIGQVGQNMVTTDVLRVLVNVYDAVAPGKEDFWYGPEYLRQVGQFVPMIANNLTVQKKPPTTCNSVPSPATSLPLLPNQISSSLSTGGGGGAGGKGKGGGSPGGSSGGAGSSGGNLGGAGGGGGCNSSGGASGSGNTSNDAEKKGNRPKLAWPDADNIYPWTSQFGLTLSGPLPPTAPPVYLCLEPTGKPEETRSASPPCTELSPDSGQNSNGSASRYTLASGDVAVLSTGELRQYDPDSQHAMLFPDLGPELTPKLCMTNHQINNESKDDDCTAIAVKIPLVERAWICPKHLRSDGQDHCAPDDYVIFGALATDTLNGLADINTEWRADRTGNTLQVGVADAGSAVAQALVAYNLVNPNLTSFGIVLAQMSPGEAKELADYLGERLDPRAATTAARINSVFSAANSTEGSPIIEVTVPRSGAQATFIPVFTPEPLFREGDCLNLDPKNPTNCFAQIDVHSGVSNTTLKNTPGQLKRTSPPNTWQIASPWETPFCMNDSSFPSWECQILQRMQQELKTDLAVLEEKNFDYDRGSNTVGASGFNLGTDDPRKALWNAGNLTRVTLLGSTLKQILQQNTKLLSANFEVLPAEKKSQQLKILGISQIGNDDYYIEGKKLSPTLKYSVATTDNLANSTSDYPQFASQDLDQPIVFWKTPDYYSDRADSGTTLIADLGAAIVSHQGNPPSNLTEAQMQPVVPPDVPNPGRGGSDSTPAQATYSYSNRTLSYNKTTPQIANIELSTQFRPVWSLALQQLAVSYSLAKPNQLDQYIGDNLGGVTNPNVASPYSDNISVLNNLRLQYYFKQHREIENDEGRFQPA